MAMEKRGALLPLLRARLLVAAGLRAGVVLDLRAGGVAACLAFAAVLVLAAFGVEEVFGVRAGIELAPSSRSAPEGR
jgi:hypothetical protein